jgi:hypothetical protein
MENHMVEVRLPLKYRVIQPPKLPKISKMTVSRWKLQPVLGVTFYTSSHSLNRIPIKLADATSTLDGPLTNSRSQELRDPSRIDPHQSITSGSMTQ